MSKRKATRLKELQVEKEVILLRREENVVAAMQKQEAKTQAYEDSWASSDPYTSRVNPGINTTANDLFQHSFGFHTARPGSRRHGDYPPFYRTEMEHWQIIDAARLLEGLCSTASNVLDVLSQFAIFTGFEYKVTLKKSAKKPPKKPPAEPEEGQPAEPVEPEPEDPLVIAAQEVIDKFMVANEWYRWETEIFRRTRRDGEAFIYMEPDEATGSLRLRSIEPEQVKEPQDTGSILSQLGVDPSMSWKYGILTPKQDTSRPEGYWVVSNYSDAQNQGEFIPAEEMIHIKTEWVDRTAKRGVSDFFSTANDIHSTRKLLRNLRESAAVQAAIAWIREHPEGMTPSRPVAVTDARGVTQSGQVVPTSRYDGPVMLDVSHGMTYKGGPIGSQQGSLIDVLQAALRAIGVRWQIPEALISGDSSNANLASNLVVEAPFVRGMTTRQWHYKLAYEAIMRRVLEYAAATGQLGAASDTVLDKIDVDAEAPPVIPRKLAEETERNDILHGARILSKQTWSRREDLDHEQEQKFLEEDPPETPQDMFGGDPEADSEEQGKVSPKPEGERVA